MRSAVTNAAELLPPATQPQEQQRIGLVLCQIEDGLHGHLNRLQASAK